jgi:hypothetical protein
MAVRSSISRKIGMTIFIPSTDFANEQITSQYRELAALITRHNESCTASGILQVGYLKRFQLINLLMNRWSRSMRLFKMFLTSH